MQQLSEANVSVAKILEAAIPVVTITVVEIVRRTAADTDPITNLQTRSFQRKSTISKRRWTADTESPYNSLSRWRQLHGERYGARNSEKKVQKKRRTTEEEEEEAREKEKKEKRRKQEFVGKEKGVGIVVVVDIGGGDRGGGGGGEGGGGGGGENEKGREGEEEEERKGDGERKGSKERWLVAIAVGSVS